MLLACNRDMMFRTMNILLMIHFVISHTFFCNLERTASDFASGMSEKDGGRDE